MHIMQTYTPPQTDEVVPDETNPLLALRVSNGVRPLILFANLCYICCRKSWWYLPESCSIFDMLDLYSLKPVHDLPKVNVRMMSWSVILDVLFDVLFILTLKNQAVIAKSCSTLKIRRPTFAHQMNHLVGCRCK
jgi:hypothetical protein